MKWKASILVLSVFLLGIVLGGLMMHMKGSSVVAGNPPAPLPSKNDDVVKQIEARCSLTPDQQKQIRAIMEDVMAQYREIYEPIRPKIEEVRQAGRQRMRGVLTPEQLPKFEEYLRWLDEEKQKQGHR
jgi:Spy/CpxP family protein refolding chaperone